MTKTISHRLHFFLVLASLSLTDIVHIISITVVREWISCVMIQSLPFQLNFIGITERFFPFSFGFSRFFDARFLTTSLTSLHMEVCSQCAASNVATIQVHI